MNRFFLVARLGDVQIPEEVSSQYDTSQLEKGNRKFVLGKRSCRPFIEDCLFDCESELLRCTDGYLLPNLEGNFFSAATICDDLDAGKLSSLSECEGDLCGFVSQQEMKTVRVFADKIGAHNVFVYCKKELAIVSNSLFLLAKLLKANGIPPSLDESSCLSLIAFGAVFWNECVIQDVVRVARGNWAELDLESGVCRVQRYHLFSNEPQTRRDVSEYIDELERRFRYGVEAACKKNEQSALMQAGMLSGGLDSRLNMAMAWKLGYRDRVNICFGATGCDDYRIAAKIAEDFQQDLLFYSLGKGNFIRRHLDESVEVADGSYTSAGSVHGLAAFRHFNTSDWGLVHSGQLGDAVLGSYLASPSHTSPKIDRPPSFLEILKPLTGRIEAVENEFENNEICKLYNRGFAYINCGYHTLNRTVTLNSPFLTKAFLDFVLSIPPEIRFNNRIYNAWMSNMHKRFASYVWDKTGQPVGTSRLRIKGYGLRKFVSLAAMKLFPKQFTAGGMNPFDYWVYNNSELKGFIELAWSNLPNMCGVPENARKLLPNFDSANAREKIHIIGCFKTFEQFSQI